MKEKIAKEKIHHDYYITPTWMVERLLEEVDLPVGHWLDPGAGDGALIEASQYHQYRNNTWDAVEINAPHHSSKLLTLAQNHDTIWSDYLKMDIKRKYDVVLCHPPYSQVMPFIQKSLPIAKTTVMLIRHMFLVADERRAFFQSRMPDVHIIPNRPTFVKGQVDNLDYAWFIWHGDKKRTTGKVTVLNSTPMSIRKK